MAQDWTDFGETIAAHPRVDGRPAADGSWESADEEKDGEDRCGHCGAGPRSVIMLRLPPSILSTRLGTRVPTPVTMAVS